MEIKELFILMIPILMGCSDSGTHTIWKDNPCRKTGENLAIDGSFERASAGQMASPWINRPLEYKESFQIIEGKDAIGNQYLSYIGEPGKWWGISQQVQLQKGKKYTASFWIRGDSTEIHTGAFNSGKFLGWNNSFIPRKQWEMVMFDFYTDSASDKTTLYIAGLHPTRKFRVDIDDLQIIQELPNK
jgi:hypothetical protein